MLEAVRSKKQINKDSPEELLAITTKQRPTLKTNNLKGPGGLLTRVIIIFFFFNVYFCENYNF